MSVETTDADRIRELEKENERLRTRIAELETDADTRTAALRRQISVVESQRNNILSHMMATR